MARLRAPGGCPWDREQTFETIKPYLLEEAYEVMDAIDAGDWRELCEELGDLILQPVFFAQMAAEAGHFDIAAALTAINEKLVRRHPHVFGDAVAETPEDVKYRWDQIKAGEKRDKGIAPSEMLQGVSRSQPALMEAQQIGSRVAKVGFDWPNYEHVIEKLHEEIEELEQARSAGTAEDREQELGDLLFVITNMARFLNVDAEQALRKANAKFRARFAYVEQRLAANGTPLGQATLEEMEEMWREAKRVL